jgi:hypothetical protein
MRNRKGYFRKVVDWTIVQGPRGGMFVRRTLNCEHITDKAFSPADRKWFELFSRPFRIPEEIEWARERMKTLISREI